MLNVNNKEHAGMRVLFVTNYVSKEAIIASFDDKTMANRTVGAACEYSKSSKVYIKDFENDTASWTTCDKLFPLTEASKILYTKK